MRRGVALPVALFTLALLSGLVVSGAFVTRQLVASTTSSLRSSDLEPLAERAVVEAIAEWDSLARAQQPVGSVFALPNRDDGSMQTQGWVTRIGGRTYWVVAESRATARPPLHRRVGVVVRVIQGVPTLLPERAWGEFP